MSCGEIRCGAFFRRRLFYINYKEATRNSKTTLILWKQNTKLTDVDVMAAICYSASVTVADVVVIRGINLR